MTADEARAAADQLEQTGTIVGDLAAEGIRALAARVTSLELALESVMARLPAAPEPLTYGIFGRACTLPPGVTVEAVRAAINAMPGGLSAVEVLAQLQADGLILEVR